MESPDSYLSRVAISNAAFMERDVALEEIGRARETMGPGAGGLYQGGVLQGISKEVFNGE